MSYLIDPANNKESIKVKQQSNAVPVTIMLSVLMSSSFLAGMQWNEFPLFTVVPALLALTIVAISRS